MDITWLTAFVDVPTDRTGAAASFWAGVTGSELSPWRDDDQFATLLPPDGDPHLRVQRTLDDHAGVHLDLHVSSIPDGAGHAVTCGATEVADHGHRIMASPAGYRFCLVGDHGERVVPSPRPDPAPHTVDQVCIDVPATRFEDECTFWAALTGWELRRGALDEFAYLVRPEGIPMRILLQRLGADDPASLGRAHLDLACGDGRDAVAEAHRKLGATFVRRERYWTTLVDPAGLPYCLTRRDPTSGNLP